MKKGIVITSILMLVLAVTAMAQAPNSFVYQGRLTTAGGDPIVNTTSVTFRVYEALSGGSPVQTWTVNVSPDANGIFTTELTSMNRTYFDGPKLYMEMVIGGQTLAPRQLITSAPYAYSSEYANTATTVPDNSITSAKIVNGTIVAADIADATITAAKMLDESGLVQTRVTSGVTVANTGVTNILSASINAPAAGYVLAMGFAYGAIGGLATGNAFGNIILGIEALATTTPGSQHFTAFGGADITLASGVYQWGSMVAQRIFSVASAGTQTYYLNANRGWTGGNAYVYYPKLVLIYLPSSYGTISTIEPDINPDDFQSARVVEIPFDPANPNQQPITAYEVDLRELELKAIKAQLEAEKAQRELLEAKQNMQEE